LFRDGQPRQAGPVITNTRKEGQSMSHRTAAWLVTGTHHLAERVRRADAEQGQGTVEYAGLAMAIGVLLLAVGSYLGGKDHGIGAVVTDAIKTAVEHATGSGGK
jgi:Flp pilus assembly pilin Flp